jgi:hypothetical protein
MESRQSGDPVQIDMRDMVPAKEARMRICVMKVASRGRWTYRDWIRWKFLWRFFPWYAREMRYRGDFCCVQSCMYWRWEDRETKERGYCSEASKIVSLLNMTRVSAADRELFTNLAEEYKDIPAGPKHAYAYQELVLRSLNALFYPNLIQPHEEWRIHDGRKRIDVVFTNAADTGFFAQRRNDPKVNANAIIVECKNYSKDIANEELDQLLGRFDDNRGKFGIMTCRAIDDPNTLLKRCQDAASRSRGYMIVLTDEDLIEMLRAKSQLRDEEVENALHRKYRDLLR